MIIRRRHLVTQVFQSLILTRMEPNTLPTGRDNHEAVKVQEEELVIKTSGQNQRPPEDAVRRSTFLHLKGELPTRDGGAANGIRMTNVIGIPDGKAKERTDRNRTLLTISHGRCLRQTCSRKWEKVCNEETSEMIGRKHS